MSNYRIDLPSYTSERYFLLSEIENSCIIHTLDLTVIPPPVNNVCFLYCLWIHSHGLEELMRTLVTLRSFKSKNSPVIVIETYSPDATDTVVSSIYSDMAEIQCQFEDSIIVFAVASDMDASPGLEFIYDCIHCTLPTSDKFIIVAATSDTFMGIGNKDPDASEGVIQCLLSNTENPVQSVAARYGLEQRVKQSDVVKKHSSKSFVDFIVILVIALVAYILYRLFLASTFSVYLAGDY